MARRLFTKNRGEPGLQNLVKFSIRDQPNGTAKSTLVSTSICFSKSAFVVAAAFGERDGSIEIQVVIHDCVIMICLVPVFDETYYTSDSKVGLPPTETRQLYGRSPGLVVKNMVTDRLPNLI